MSESQNLTQRLIRHLTVISQEVFAEGTFIEEDVDHEEDSWDQLDEVEPQNCFKNIVNMCCRNRWKEDYDIPEDSDLQGENDEQNILRPLKLNYSKSK